MDLDHSELARLRAGDVRALEGCWRLYGERVLRLCANLLGNPDDAEDAAQEVFLKVFERAHQYQGESRFSTWIWRLTVNHCLNRMEREELRRGAPLPVRTEDEPVDDALSPPDAAHASEERESLYALLDRLEPAQRAVILLREVEGLAYSEIAEVLAVPVGTVISRLSRARERLVALARAPRESQAQRTP